MYFWGVVLVGEEIFYSSISEFVLCKFLFLNYD